MVLFLLPSAASLQFSGETSEMVNRRNALEEKLTKLNALFFRPSQGLLPTLATLP